MSAQIQMKSSRLCVGRERELETLRLAYDDACCGEERFVIIQGPSGVGKTRLTEAFRTQVRLNGGVVLEGRCTLGARALSPLSQLLRHSLSFLEMVGVTLDQELEPLSFLLTEDLVLPRNSPGDHVGERHHFYKAYVWVLRQVASLKTPLIVLHDLQWADPVTVELLLNLLDGASPLSKGHSRESRPGGLVVATLRGNAKESTAVNLLKHPSIQLMTLGGLDEEGLREYLQSDEIVQHLMSTTGGNPEEIRALLMAPSSGVDGGIWLQIQSLSREAQQLLTVMAVLGRPGSAERLTRAAGLSRAGRVLTEILESGLVSKTLDRGKVVLALTRSRIGDCILSRISTDAKRHAHAELARCLAPAGGLAAQELAYHAIRTGDAELAFAAAQEAATALELTYAYEASASLLEEVLPLVEPAEKRQLHQHLADLYERLGRYIDALNHALSCVEEDRDCAPEALLQVGKLMVLAGRYDGAPDVLDRVAAIADTRKDGALFYELAAARAEMLYRRGDLDAALDACDEASHGKTEAALLAKNTRGKISWARGDLKAAREAFESNLKEARAQGMQRLEFWATLNIGIVEMGEHNNDRARKAFEETLARARQVKDRRACACALGNLAVLAHIHCRYSEALCFYHQSVAERKLLGTRDKLRRTAQNMGELYLELNDSDRAQQMVDFARQLTSKTLSCHLEGEGMLLEIRVAIARTDTEKAAELVNQARELYKKQGALGRLAELDLEESRLDYQRGAFITSRQRLERIRSHQALTVFDRGRAAQLEADIMKKLGERHAAMRLLLTSLNCFEKAERPEYIWRVHFRIASLLADDGDENGSARHLRQAAAIAESLRSNVPEGFEETYDAQPERVALYEVLGKLRSKGEQQRSDDAELAEEKVGQSQEYVRTQARNQAGRIHQNRQKTERSSDYSDLRQRLSELVWQSTEMDHVLERVCRIAESDALVLIRGESGTGKELIARALHRLGPRHGAPLITVNCAALVESLLLSELFGHEKGAFTGATQRRAGRFESAHKGTLFLDEIGDISLKTQVSLLRVLQEQVFERVGGTRPVRVDARLICATNRDLESLVQQGLFREDLYYRLKAIEVFVPPLRHRRDDIEPLVNHVLQRVARERNQEVRRLSGQALELLTQYSWPGNVRELENMLRSASLFVDGPEISKEDLLKHSTLGTGPSVEFEKSERLIQPERHGSIFEEVINSDLNLSQWKKKFEGECVRLALEKTNGNITRAAGLLGLKRPRLSQLVREHELKV